MSTDIKNEAEKSEDNNPNTETSESKQEPSIEYKLKESEDKLL